MVRKFYMDYISWFGTGQMVYSLKLILVKTKLPIGEYFLNLCPRACSKENMDDSLTDQPPHKWSSHLVIWWTL